MGFPKLRNPIGLGKKKIKEVSDGVNKNLKVMSDTLKEINQNKAKITIMDVHVDKLLERVRDLEIKVKYLTKKHDEKHEDGNKRYDKNNNKKNN